MDTAFSFDQKQRNTLKASGLAAYVQRSPLDRVGWVHAEEVWLADWRPKKRAYQVQHIEVTLGSFWKVEEYKAQDFDFEPWDMLMLTAYETFLTDEIRRVEDFFANFIDKAAFAQHPDRVKCPHEYANEELSTELPARWSMIQRKWAALLMRLKDSGQTAVWQEPGRRIEGRVKSIELLSFEFVIEKEVKRLSFFERYGVQLYTVHDDGYVETLWHEPSPRIALDPSTLPIWDYTLDQWVMPEETGANE